MKGDRVKKSIVMTDHEISILQQGRLSQAWRKIKYTVHRQIEFMPEELKKDPKMHYVNRHGKQLFLDVGMSDKKELPFQYGKPGDILFVKECICTKYVTEDQISFAYWSDGFERTIENKMPKRFLPGPGGKTVSADRLPEFMSRFTVKITEIHRSRVQQVSAHSAMRSGCRSDQPEKLIEYFKGKWIAQNGKPSWDHDCWCDVISFDLHTREDRKT
jgi:hypothetical protein